MGNNEMSQSKPKLEATPTWQSQDFLRMILSQSKPKLEATPTVKRTGKRKMSPVAIQA